MPAEHDPGLSFLFDTAFRYQPDFNRYVSNYVGLLKHDNPFMDDTQMSLAQQTLRVEFYRLCLESLGLASFDGLLILDYNGILLEINPAAEKALAIKRADVVGQPYFKQLFPGNHIDDYLAWIKQHAKSRDSESHRKSTEMLLIKGNGTIFPADVKVTEVTIFGSTLLVFCFNDITRRKWMDQALKYTEERYRKIMGENADAIFLIDPRNKRIEECNPAFNIMLGYNDDELFAMRLYDVLEGDPEDIDAWVDKRLRQGTSLLLREQGRFFTRNRHPVDVEYSVSVFDLRDHPILCIIARDTVPREITVRRQLADDQVGKLEKQLQKLASGLEELSQTKLTKAQQEILDELMTHQDKLQHELQREQATGTDSGLPIRPLLQPFELKTALFEVQNLFADKLAAKDLPLLISVEPDVPDVLIGDPIKLQEMLYHLVDNAVRHTDEGNLMLKVRVTQSERSNATVMFALRDTASGVDAVTKAKISDVFSDDQPLELGRKYGIRGLAICSRYAKALGGRIWFNTLEGKGSSFLFSLPMELTEQEPQDLPELDLLEVMEHLRNLGDSPLHEQQEAEHSGGFTLLQNDAETETQEDASHGERLRLLLVESDVDQVIRLQQAVAGRAIDLRMVDNGRKALALLKEQPFDMVLMALDLPVMDGLATATAVRDWEQTHQHEPLAIVAMLSPQYAELSEDALQDFDRAELTPLSTEDFQQLLNWGEEHRHQRPGSTPPAAWNEPQPVAEDREPARPAATTPVAELDFEWDLDSELAAAGAAPSSAEPEPAAGGVQVILSADMAKLAPDFLNKRRQDIAKLRQAITDNRFDHVRVLGKSMKGTGGVYGFSEIAEMGRELETAAETQDMLSIGEWVDQLENFLTHVQIVIA
ncbi:MAG: PAS domain S-box protein [Candidatus Sericytochromatia bacterium]